MGGVYELRVLARYSFWKVGFWVAAAGGAGSSILYDGWSHHWQPEAGSLSANYFYLAVGGAPFLLVIAGAMALTFMFHRGVAIAIRGDELILNLPMGPRRISLREHLTIDAETSVIETQMFGTLGFFKAPPAYARQVAFYQRDKAPLAFRTGLLTEPAQTIADRVRGAIR